MPTYSVHLVQTVSTTVEVEADTVEDALEKVYDTANWDKPVWPA